MKNFFLFISFILISTTIVKAQETYTDTPPPNGNQADILDIPEGMRYEVDSLLNDWYSKNYIMQDSTCRMSDVNPYYSDSVYIDRLSRIPAIMEMPYNETVRKFIDMYAGKLRKSVSFMLGAANFYMPLFEEALDAYNLPQELKYLPIIESALNPSAISRAGASGLWQFMIGTGKNYGLESNSLIDDRRDPIKATWAAARYLRDLYNIYQDWNLVIAAYNCGPGNINKAIRRSGGAKDYWSIYEYLPRETRGYVPAFIAANYIMTYYCDHNICPMEAEIPASTDTLQINRNLHFQQIAGVCGMDIEQIRALNPQYKRDIVPGNMEKSYTLRLPRNYVSSFIDRQDSIYAYHADELFNNRKIVAAKSETTNKRGASVAPSGSVTYHKIQRGETLSTIARKYRVTVNKLKQWNNLRNTNITAGKRLKIYR